jgi:hypothetical protein
MKNKEAKALEKEYNETIERGRELWAQIEPMADRCNAILEELRNAKVQFDEIALIFGGELQLDLAGGDEEKAGA